MNWSSSILWGIIGIASTIFFGFFFSYIFYRKGQKQKKLMCYRNSITLISESISKYKELKILYNDNEIQTITSTFINFKNVGNDIIEPNDIVPTDPIIISTSGNFLSSAENTLFEINVTHPKINANLISINTSNITLNFDFLPPKAEISITLLHSGDIAITGDLKMGSFKKNTKNSSFESTISNMNLPEKIYSSFVKFNCITLKILYIFAIVFLVMSPLSLILNDNNQITKDDILLFISYVIIGLFLLIFLKFERKIENLLFPQKNDNIKNID